jgi:hypothetical protein
MGFIVDLFWALLKVGLPLAALSFAMVWWALYRGMLAERDDAKALLKEIQVYGKQRSKEKEKPPLNPLHGKWFQFGGGFYGLMALYTYLLIEADEVLELFGQLGAIVFRLDLGLLIEFFIESLMNFIAAIAWPVYWIGETENGHFWIWFLVAYGGYWAGLQLAQWVAREKFEQDPMQFIARFLERDDSGS